ncbi:hypothetical protein [Exiguobacterium sp. s138]|uniref:hypothetical protein n=1 Tax=Exiguobacterium sp. s138 TaxID=2751202 RepID=UPI001BE60845|nr:hypothetical protein [Exiguobacterium sp. s138]
MSLINNILRILTSNIVLLIGNLIVAFHLPGVLEKSDYGTYRQIVLISTFLGMFHFGYLDGILLKYGHNIQKINEEDKNNVKNDHLNFILLQFSIFLIGLIMYIYSKELMFLYGSFLLIPINVSFFHKNLYQSIGNMKLISRATIIYSITNTCFILFGTFNQIIDVSYYVWTLIVSNLIMLCVFEVIFYKNYGFKVKFYLDLKENINKGISILTSNLLYLFVTSLTAISIQIFFGIREFANFSIATSLLSMIMILVSAISLPFYNFLKNSNRKEDKKTIKSIFLITGVFFQGSYFLIEILINKILPEYKASIDYLFVMLMLLPYLMIINILIINLYKVSNKAFKMMKTTFLILIFSITLHSLLSLIFENVQFLVVGNLIVIIVWYIYSTEIEFKELKNSAKDMFFLTVSVIFYVTLFYLELGSFSKFLIYYFFVGILIIISYKKLLVYIIKKIKKR